MATLGLTWIKDHFADIEFYSLETTAIDGSNFGDEFKDDTYSANFAMLHYDDGDKPHMYFLVDLFKAAKVRQAAAVRAALFCSPPPLFSRRAAATLSSPSSSQV
jgi:hypothetical protein